MTILELRPSTIKVALAVTLLSAQIAGRANTPAILVDYLRITIKDYIKCLRFVKLQVRQRSTATMSHMQKQSKEIVQRQSAEQKFFWPEQDCWIDLKVSAKGIRTINKKGINAALIQAAKKGRI